MEPQKLHATAASKINRCGQAGGAGGDKFQHTTSCKENEMFAQRETCKEASSEKLKGLCLFQHSKEWERAA